MRFLIPFGNDANRPKCTERTFAPRTFALFPVILVGLFFAVLDALFPCFERFLGDYRVIKSPVVTQNEATKRSFADFLPAFRVARIPCKGSQRFVIVGQAGGRLLVPRCAPEQDRGTELVATSMDSQLAVAQSVDVQWHERH